MSFIIVELKWDPHIWTGKKSELKMNLILKRRVIGLSPTAIYKIHTTLDVTG